MGTFLVAAYNLRLKAIYVSIKKNLPGKLTDWKPTENRKIATAYMLPKIKKAYTEGINFAVIDSLARTKQNIKPDYSIDKKAKNKLLVEYIARIKAAEAVYVARMEGYRAVKATQPGVTKRENPKKDQIYNEYTNAVNAASNNLILRAGAMGSGSVYKELQ